MSMLGRPPHPGEPGNPLPGDNAPAPAYAVCSPSKRACLGYATMKPDGWIFLPNVGSRNRSRRYWPTPEASLPRWVRQWMNKADFELMTVTQAQEQGILK